MFGDPLDPTGEWRTFAGPIESACSHRSMALSVPQSTGHIFSGAAGTPLELLFSTRGRSVPLVLGHVGSQPALAPDGADGSWNAPRFVPRRERHLAFGAGWTSQWAERSARRRLSRSDANERALERPRGSIHGVDHPTRGGLLQQSHKIVYCQFAKKNVQWTELPPRHPKLGRCHGT